MKSWQKGNGKSLEKNGDEQPETIDVNIELFEFLVNAGEKHLVDRWEKILGIMKGDDPILAMEAEQVLKELLPDLPGEAKEQVKEALRELSNRVAEGIGRSSLVDLDLDGDEL